MTEVRHAERPRIAIIDYEMGNRVSVLSALSEAGANARITNDPEDMATSDGVVLPGVGAFPAAMDKLDKYDLPEHLGNFRQLGRPILGICLGMQMMFERSFEHTETEGLGWIEGEVRKLDSTKRKLPVVGWATVAQKGFSDLFDGINDLSAFYHLHEMAATGVKEEEVIGTTNYFGSYVSAVQSGNVYGVQFHPENSGYNVGVKLLRNFVDLCRQPAEA